MKKKRLALFLVVVMMIMTACSSRLTVYHDPNMDFGSIRNVAVMPFENLVLEKNAAERVRDVFINTLIATGNVYVIPPGEVRRGISNLSLADPAKPSKEDIIKLGAVLGADSVVIGTLKEYGEVRSAQSTANLISLSVQLIEAQTGRVVWTASTTEGGISFWDRMFGGGGRPMNDVTEKAVIDVINSLF